MKRATSCRSNSNNKLRDTSTKAHSPSFCTMSALRRIDSLLLSASEKVLKLNDALYCHIDSSNSHFKEIKDKIINNTVKTQNQFSLILRSRDLYGNTAYQIGN